MAKIARYHVVAELGKGAMGVVYKATDPNIGRTVAIKVLRLDASGSYSEALGQRMKNEARAVGAMNHPNIVTIYDAGEHEGMFYIAMEYVEGRTLLELLAQQKVLPVDTILDITRQVCAGLDYAHARGIIHRDIKPANIMIRADGSVKIMDFGIAKLGATCMTSTGQVVGTPNYMAPEQVKGIRMDGRADLFSVGVMVYEMLTGERPFSGERITTVIYKIVNEDPPRPRDLDSAVHPGLSAAVMKALAKAPEDRYAKCAELAYDLENFRSFPVGSAAVPDSATVLVGSDTASAAAPRMAQAPPAVPPAASSIARTDAPRAAAKAAPSSSNSRQWIVVAAIALIITAGAAYVRFHRPAPSTPAQPAQTQPANPDPAPQAAVDPNRPADAIAETPTPADDSQPAPEPSAPGMVKPAPILGGLRIASTPPGATVVIDGRTNKSWVTPFTASRLKPGRYTVSFSLYGYRPETRQVEVIGGQNVPLAIELLSAKATLSVNSNPSGAQILVDGVDTGQLTPSRISINPGTHRIAVRKQGFNSQMLETNLLPGGTSEFAPVLTPVPAATPVEQAASTAPAPARVEPEDHSAVVVPFRMIGGLFKRGGNEGSLQVHTNPKGAEVWVGDKKARKTPAKISLPPGTYIVTVKAAGYKQVRRSVIIEKGKITKIEETLRPQ